MPKHERMINTKDLWVGAFFSEPLFFDDGKHMFLASEMPLSQGLLDILHDWNIPFVLTSGLELLPPVDEEGCEDYEEIPELESVG